MLTNRPSQAYKSPVRYYLSRSYSYMFRNFQNLEHARDNPNEHARYRATRSRIAGCFHSAYQSAYDLGLDYTDGRNVLDGEVVVPGTDF